MDTAEDWYPEKKPTMEKMLTAQEAMEIAQTSQIDAIEKNWKNLLQSIEVQSKDGSMYTYSGKPLTEEQIKILEGNGYVVTNCTQWHKVSWEPKTEQ